MITDRALEKLGRSEESLDRLTRAWQTYCSFNQLSYETVLDPQAHAINVIARVAEPPPLTELEGHLHPAIANAREAFDNLVYRIGIAAGASPTVLRKNAFPIITSQSEWKTNPKRIRLEMVPHEYVQRIRDVQPFRQASAPDAPHPLVFLHEMANSEKHRDGYRIKLLPAPPPGIHLLGSGNVTVPAEMADEVAQMMSNPDDWLDLDLAPVEDGAVVARLRFPRTIDLATAAMDDFDLPLGLNAELVDPCWSLPVIDAMRGILRYARAALLYIAGEGSDEPPDPFDHSTMALLTAPPDRD